MRLVEVLGDCFLRQSWMRVVGLFRNGLMPRTTFITHVSNLSPWNIIVNSNDSPRIPNKARNQQ